MRNLLKQSNLVMLISGVLLLALVSVGTILILNSFDISISSLVEEEKEEEILPIINYHVVQRDIIVKNYFAYMDTLSRTYFSYVDSLAEENDSLIYALGEHLIVRTNPWLIDSLENTDYYRLKEKGIFSYDQSAIVVLHKGDSLIVPDSSQIALLLDKQAKTTIDVNIPEFKLRIIEDGKELYKFPVRVGQNRSKYLAMAGRKVDLRTHTGIGSIVRINKNAAFVDPKNNHRYYTTNRDDNKRTLVPIVPWLEPGLNGTRYGQLIHPTTNPVSLGKAYSNGCIGMKEADTWRVYYHAPLGTRVVFRYELTVIEETGDTILLKDIYPNKKHINNAVDIAMAYMKPIELKTFEAESLYLANKRKEKMKELN